MAHTQMSRYYFGLSFWNKINSLAVVNGESGAVSSRRASSRRGGFLLSNMVLRWANVWHWDCPSARWCCGLSSLPLPSRKSSGIFHPAAHHNLAVLCLVLLFHTRSACWQAVWKVDEQLYSCQQWQWASSYSCCVAVLEVVNRRNLYI